MTAAKFTKSDIKKINSNKSIKYLLQGKEPISIIKALKFVKYEEELEEHQAKLIMLQQWVINNGKRLCVIFEGRDAAGKGGAIRRITHHLNPRHYKVVALPKPTEIEKGQWYFQRYIKELPNPGEIVFFDRSWYNRAIVEPVNGFCTNDEYNRFMDEVNNFEAMITNDGIILMKFYISISKEEQAKRFEEIQNDPLKMWKMTPVDEKAQDLWDLYTSYKEKMFEQTHNEKNPWVIIQANKKMRARMKIIKHFLANVPY